MSDNRSGFLPDGTDTVIEGAARIDDSGTQAVENRALTKDKEITATQPERSGPGSGGSEPAEPGRSVSTSGGSSSIVDRFRSGSEQLTSQAGEKARGLVSQGLERTAEALANVSKMVGDTASGIEERLGPEYGDYARRAAGAIENAANAVASKDPDELIEDTRNMVRNSPGLALAGAAVVGFVLARVLKTGLGGSRGETDED